MRGSENRSNAFGVRGYVWAVAVVWTLVIAGSLVWNFVRLEQQVFESARIQARVTYEKDVIYRRWNALHGGVYVPVTEETPPNPYLDVPERDITTPSGRWLTLVNPAYMTRQVHELARGEIGVLGHITSLDPIRPQNVADPWETRALESFQRGAIEVSSVEQIDGLEYMRLMRPLVTEESCLKCHAAQGYQVGDIRGGISVAVPLQPLRTLASDTALTFVLAHGLLWLIVLGGLGLGARRLSGAERKRQRAEARLQRYAVDLERSNQELQQFAFVVSHDLQEPLRMVTSYLKLLERRYGDRLDVEAGEYIFYAVDGAARMQALIKGILDLSRVSTRGQEFVPTDCEVVLARVLRNLGVVIKESGAVVTHDPLPTVVADEAQLERVFQNLIGNALKFRGVEPLQVHVSAKRQTDEWVLAVRDNGLGIAPAHFGRIFEIFQRLHTREEYPGTGIGLAICRKIVERHGGRIWVESEPGAGATFYFTIPIVLGGSRSLDDGGIPYV